MALRDWFAGKAMQGEIASSSTEECCDAIARAADQAGRTIAAHIAHNSYEFADAMMAEREKSGRSVVHHFTEEARGMIERALNIQMEVENVSPANVVKAKAVLDRVVPGWEVEIVQGSGRYMLVKLGRYVGLEVASS